MSRLIYKKIKRLLDIFCAILAIPFFLPPICIFGFLVFCSDFSNPIYISRRAGKSGKKFNFYKLRTMHPRPKFHEKAKYDYLYNFKLGRWMRSFSIDELPQIWNIIKGDLSFVGPRPLLPEYLPLYTDEQYKRNNVRPGLTGLAQVKGRNLLSWEKRLSLDSWYSTNYSFVVDFKIILKTFFVVLTRKGINFNKSITMEPFKGSSEIQKD